MIAQYKPNETDEPIIADITAILRSSLPSWYGDGARLDEDPPEIRSYRNSFIMRYSVTLSSGAKRKVLVKIRRNPKMDSLWRAVEADIHANVPGEFSALELVFSWLAGADEDFGVIRPLEYIEKYFAIVMEEIPSRTLRQILVSQRHSRSETDLPELKDAARKTGRWLHNFHHNIHTPMETPYSTGDILHVVEGYAVRLETYSRGRVRAPALIQSFATKLENVQLESMLFCQSHADMTCDNVLYSDEQKICVIDIKTRLAPIYADLGLILIHPETFKPQIFSGGKYLREPLLQLYREAILAGYFENEPRDDFMVRLFSAIRVLDKWTMYEELMHRYKGFKHMLSVPIGPFVTAYFRNVLYKHLALIRAGDRRQPFPLLKPVDPVSKQILAFLLIFCVQAFA